MLGDEGGSGIGTDFEEKRHKMCHFVSFFVTFETHPAIEASFFLPARKPLAIQRSNARFNAPMIPDVGTTDR